MSMEDQIARMAPGYRELLELAAKAAGYELFIDDLANDYEMWLDDEPWDPLSDDGDALRLAVKLSLSIEPSVGHCAVAFDDQKGDVGLVEQDDGEEGLLADSEIVRRAIVRAAAEIGRAMP